MSSTPPSPPSPQSPGNYSYDRDSSKIHTRAALSAGIGISCASMIFGAIFTANGFANQED